ncbi:MAG: pyridoxal-phosphate dependent enzyme [Pseudomonadota bacterium]
MAAARRGTTPRFGGATLAEGIAVKRPGRLTLPLIARHVDDILLVSEARIEEAIGLLVDSQNLVVEGAGAAGVAALIDQPDRFRGRRVGTVLCGANIDRRVLSSILMRGMVRDGRFDPAARRNRRYAGHAGAVDPRDRRRRRQHRRDHAPAPVPRCAGQVGRGRRHRRDPQPRAYRRNPQRPRRRRYHGAVCSAARCASDGSGYRPGYGAQVSSPPRIAASMLLEGSAVFGQTSQLGD